MSKSKKERTVEIQKSLETRAKYPISYFDSRKYIQHNVNLADGLGAILAFMDALPADRTKVDVLRAFEDGDFSVAHADYELGDWGRMVGFEIHRWENDRIVEHWDNLQAKPSSPNTSGRTMTDGASEVTDIERTDDNKALIEQFTIEILITQQIEKAGVFFKGNELIQHSPLYGDGLDALLEVLRAAVRDKTGPEYIRLHKILGEGNLVLAISEGTTGKQGQTRQPAAFYDLYRLESNAIAEHWEAIEIIPPRETWQNDNGKF
ncbi:MAG: hypothetical protein V7K89_00195 [Nostoc sp.]|uniref:nuclear transport factor 2 family protein n=1 Tax=Nostoc sp. TaxID=1180 RepID=UPI002FFBF376